MKLDSSRFRNSTLARIHALVRIRRDVRLAFTMISLVIILLTSHSGASAQTNSPTVRSHRVTEPIHVDGKLDEPIYAGAAPA